MHGRAYYLPVARDSASTNWTNEAPGIYKLSRWICSWGKKKKANKALSLPEGHLCPWKQRLCVCCEGPSCPERSFLPHKPSPRAVSLGASLMSRFVFPQGCTGYTPWQVFGNISQALGILPSPRCPQGQAAISSLCWGLCWGEDFIALHLFPA